MNKVLLVYEDYSELMSLEGLLKRVGFDVIGLTSEYSVTEQVLAFNPDVVVGSGRGGKVSSLGVGKRLKDMNRWSGKSILIFPPGYKPTPPELMRIRADMFLEAPVLNARVVQVIGKLLGADEKDLLDKLAKLSSSESGVRDSQISFSNQQAKSLTQEEAIYIRGSTATDKNENVKVDPQESSLIPAGEKRKIKFNLNDEVRPAAEKTPPGSPSAASGFSDVDLKALEQEVLGGGVPVVEKIEVPTTPLVERRQNNSLPAEDEADSASGMGTGSSLPVSFRQNVDIQTESEEAYSLESLEKELESFSLNSEQVSERSPENKAGKTQEPPQTPSFVAQSEEALDLEALEKELLAAAPADIEDTGFKDVSLTELADEVKELQRKALADLASSSEKLRKKMANYQSLVADVKLSPKSELTRVETHRRQKQLRQDWDEEKNSDNDKLRQEFTVALFKK